MKIIFTAVVCIFVCVGSSTIFAQEHTEPAMLQVVEVKLGTNVQDRMITGEATVFQKNSKVFLWMKFSAVPSEQVTVTWKTGSYSHATTLVIGGSPWRTWASKVVGRTGDWTVTLADAAGNVLKEMSFKVE